MNKPNRKLNFNAPMGVPMTGSSGKLRLPGANSENLSLKPQSMTSPSNLNSPRTKSGSSFKRGGQIRDKITKYLSEQIASNVKQSYTNVFDTDSSNDGKQFSDTDTRTGFYDLDSNEIVKFKATLPAVTHLNELTLPSVPATNGEFVTPYHLNVASIGEAWLDSSNTLLRSSIFLDYSRDVLAKVKSNIVDIFTQTEFDNLMYENIKFMERYYTADSILSFRSRDNAKDANRAIESHAGAFDSFDILTQLNSMRRTARGLWMPPKLAQLIRWTYQNYKAGPNDQSANIRLVSHVTFVQSLSSDSPSASELNTLLSTSVTNVSTAARGKLNSILSDVYPWGRINNLPKSCNFAVYDEDFSEIFSNQPTMNASAVTAGEIYGYPASVSNTLTDIPYYINRSPENGMSFAFAMQDILQTGTANGFVLSNREYTLLKCGCPITGGSGVANRTNKFFAETVTTSLQSCTFKSISDNSTTTNRMRCILGSMRPNAHYHIKTNTTDVFDFGSTAPNGGAYQRVFYNNKTAPYLIGSTFVDYLFGLN